VTFSLRRSSARVRFRHERSQEHARTLPSSEKVPCKLSASTSSLQTGAFSHRRHAAKWREGQSSFNLKFWIHAFIHRNAGVATPRRRERPLERARAVEEVIIEPNLVQNPSSRGKERWCAGSRRSRRLRSLRCSATSAARSPASALSDLAQPGWIRPHLLQRDELRPGRGALSVAYVGCPRCGTCDTRGSRVRGSDSQASIRERGCEAHRLRRRTRPAALFSTCREKIRLVHNAVDTDEFSSSAVVHAFAATRHRTERR